MAGENKPADFFSAVRELVACIPNGRVTSYGAIARFCGSGKSARMVGWVLHSQKFDDHFIPAHRVVNRNGLLTGKHAFGGENIMAELLRSEGVEVENDQVVNFRALFWDPNKELI